MRTRNSFTSLVAAAALVVATLLAAPAAHAATSVERLAGADRYATSAALSAAAYPDGADVVVVASGASFADALSAGPVAAQWGGPLLLTHPDALPAATKTELTRLAPSRIVIVGGTGAVSAAAEAQLAGYASAVERIGGDNRYDTSTALVARAFPAGAREVFVVTGADFPDALSAGAYAALREAPVLLASDSAAELPPLLRTLGAVSATIVGGPGAVSEDVATLLRGAGVTVSRVQGADRYETSQNLAAEFGQRAGAIIASGAAFPDALSAVTLAAVRGEPVLLSSPLCASEGFLGALETSGATRLTLAGGPAAIRGLVGSLTPCQSLADPRSLWVMVNKKNPLRPASYAPATLRTVNLPGTGQMRPDAATALERLSAASVQAGAGPLCINNGYRSYATQQAVYADHVRARGQAGADLISARPSHSEHQTGWAVDVGAAQGGGCGFSAFGTTTQSRWVAAHAHEFGFIVRYPEGQTAVTGYVYEPWHLRFVGVELASDYAASGLRTLEQYLGYPAAAGY